MYLAVSDYVVSVVLFSVHRSQRAKVRLLHEQGNGGHKDPVLQNGTNDLSFEKRRLETLPILSSPPSDCTHKSTA